MDENQIKELVSSMLGLVKRISNQEKSSPAEIAALPEIVKELRELTRMLAM